MARIIFLAAAQFVVCCVAVAQQPSSASAPGIDNAFVQKQFGATCTLVPGPQPQMADLDGDGVQDLVIVARCTNPLVDQAEHSFQLIDPFNAFYGYGDTKITSQFASEDPQTRGIVLLIIHGAGAEAWRASTPKAKFVVINLPFREILVRKLQVKKKTLMAIYAEETGGNQITSAIFWDGKKYRYQPLGSGME